MDFVDIGRVKLLNENSTKYIPFGNAIRKNVVAKKLKISCLRNISASKNQLYGMWQS